ncbi:unnamed protein product [Moneuplotes crassus]|uniref:Uncharacterized protein n=1 Tax=Euplotes crassus TaxID=5936 RepID=A0AAD1XP79_EUPCR|nr:unnamed protein product [Moneuplotes crassus]
MDEMKLRETYIWMEELRLDYWAQKNFHLNNEMSSLFDELKNLRHHFISDENFELSSYYRKFRQMNIVPEDPKQFAINYRGFIKSMSLTRAIMKKFRNCNLKIFKIGKVYNEGALRYSKHLTPKLEIHRFYEGLAPVLEKTLKSTYFDSFVISRRILGRIVSSVTMSEELTFSHCDLETKEVTVSPTARFGMRYLILEDCIDSKSPGRKCDVDLIRSILQSGLFYSLCKVYLTACKYTPTELRRMLKTLPASTLQCKSQSIQSLVIVDKGVEKVILVRINENDKSKQKCAIF